MMQHEIPWDEWFIREAYRAAERSKDPSRKVGCVIVRDADHREIARGYNGLPKGIADTAARYEDTEFKAACVIHAEDNALQLAEPRSLHDCTAYISWHPCAKCTGLMIARGIRRFVIGPQVEPVSEKWQKNFAIAQQLLVEVGAETLMVKVPGDAAIPNAPAKDANVLDKTRSLFVNPDVAPDAATPSPRRYADKVGGLALLVSPEKGIGILAKIEGFKDAVTDRLSMTVIEEYASDEAQLDGMRTLRPQNSKAEWSSGANLFYYPDVGHAYDLGPFETIAMTADTQLRDGWFTDSSLCARLVKMAIGRDPKRI